MATKFDEMAEGVVTAMRGWIKPALEGIRGNVGGLVQRADKHGQQISALNSRVAALERKLAEKEK